MTCTVCGKRSARRGCPALKSDICAVCCGTKRLTEIRCPADCHYLATAREHPAAVIRRQQEDDLRVFLPAVRDLTEPQANLLWRVLAFVREYRGDVLLRTTDSDVEAAARALAATYETATRGLIYEERPASLAAQRLAVDLKAFIAQMEAGERSAALDRNLAAVFRAIERGAQEAARHQADGGDTAYLQLVRRLIVPSQPEAGKVAGTDAAGGGSLLIRP